MQTKCFDHKGIVYQSQSERAKAYGQHPKTVKCRLDRGWPLEDALTIKVGKKPLSGNICQDHLGNIYKSQIEMCKKWGLTYNTYRSRDRNGWSLKDNLTTPVKNKERHIEYQGKIYSITALANKLDISISCLSKGLRQNKEIEDIVKIYKSRMNPTHYDPINKEYASLKKISKNHGIKYTTLLRRLDNGYPMEQALTKRIIQNKTEFRDHHGKVYPSLQKMCDAYDVPLQTYKSRRKMGKSVEEALTTKVDRTRCATFKAIYLFQIDNKKYYGAICNICNEEYVLTREEMFAHQKKYHENECS